MKEVYVVLTTFGDEKTARRVARKMVERKLVACVNLSPGATSIYQWQGNISEEQEVLAMMKTTKELYQELEKVLAEEHPYEVPEILAISAEAGSDSYLNFVRESVGR